MWKISVSLNIKKEETIDYPIIFIITSNWIFFLVLSERAICVYEYCKQALLCYTMKPYFIWGMVEFECNQKVKFSPAPSSSKLC